MFHLTLGNTGGMPMPTPNAVVCHPPIVERTLGPLSSAAFQSKIRSDHTDLTHAYAYNQGMPLVHPRTTCTHTYR